MGRQACVYLSPLRIHLDSKSLRKEESPWVMKQLCFYNRKVHFRKGHRLHCSPDASHLCLEQAQLQVGPEHHGPVVAPGRSDPQNVRQKVKLCGASPDRSGQRVGTDRALVFGRHDAWGRAGAPRPTSKLISPSLSSLVCRTGTRISALREAAKLK